MPFFATFADAGLEKSYGWREFSAKSFLLLGEWFEFRRIFFFREWGRAMKSYFLSDMDFAWFNFLSLQIGVPQQMTVAFFCRFSSFSLRYQVEISWRKMVSNKQLWISSNQNGGWWLAIGGTMVPSRMFCFRRWNDMGILGLTMPKWQNCSAEFGCRDCH